MKALEYGCIAEKLTHSFSKEIHAQLFSYNYELLELTKEELPEFMKAKAFKAINVTIPYKKAVIPFLDYVSEKAELIGAVNTIVNKNGKLYGYNTDFEGMRSLIEHNKIDFSGKKVLILGSGGTSATALAVANSLGALSVLGVSRKEREGFITYDEALKLHTDAQIIINTTPCGMYPIIDDYPIDINCFKALEAVVDAIYNPLCSRLVVEAKVKGITAVGGLYMLVAQAVFAAEKFTDTKIPSQKIEEVYGNILKSKQNIVLIGMPSSGKSTIGKGIAEELGMQFLDTDTKILEKIKMEISEFFELFGEKEFRKIEAEVIKDISAIQNTVIATGGGAVLNNQNIKHLRQNGRIYFLDRPLNKLIVTDDRPLSSNREKLEKLYGERYDIYKANADKTIKCYDSINKNIQAVKEDFLKCKF